MPMSNWLNRFKVLYKTAKGKLALFFAAFPVWLLIYNAIDAWGNLQMITDYLPSIWKFINSPTGTLIVMVVGFGLTALFLYRQKPLVGEAMLKHQAEHIDEFVYVEHIKFATSYEDKKISYVMFDLRVFNTSVYEVVLDSTIGGEILFEGRKLKHPKIIYSNPPLTIKPNSKIDTFITHEVSDKEIKEILDAFSNYNKRKEQIRNKRIPDFCKEETDFQTLGEIINGYENIYPPLFQYHGLKIIVKGNHESENEIKPQTLKIMKNSLELIINEDSFQILP